MAVPAAKNWAVQVLSGVGAPATPENLRYMSAWAQAEGGSASNNPFNTTQPGYGATGNYNSVGVKQYGTPQGGIQATIHTLMNGHYGNILQALKSGQSAQADAHALAASPWGTGSLVEKVLGGKVTGGQVTPQMSGGQSQGVVQTQAQQAPNQLASFLLQSAQNGGHIDPAGLLSLIQSRQQGQAAQQTFGQTNPTGNIRGPVNAGKIVAGAQSALGTPYQWGGNTWGKGLDCSSFTQQALAKAGIKVGRTTYEQYKQGTAVDLHNLKPGDLVFTEPGHAGPGHVGLYVGNGTVQESPHTGDVNKKIDLNSFLKGGFVGARRYS